MDNKHPEQHPSGGAVELDNIEKKCEAFRRILKHTADEVLLLKKDPHFKAQNPSNSEMLANIMLAYRHLEDARMRLGKVIQAYDGGVSCYDKAFDNQDPVSNPDSGPNA